MAAAKACVARRNWPLREKRRIVELTMLAGTSVVEIARANVVHPNIVHQWRRLYRAGDLEAQSSPAPQSDSPIRPMFVPLRVIPAVRTSRSAMQRDRSVHSKSIMHVMLASGSALQIESAAIDATLVCAVIAELRR